MKKYNNVKVIGECWDCRGCYEVGLPAQDGMLCPYDVEQREFVNLTPHSIVLNEGDIFEASGEILRLSQQDKVVVKMANFDIKEVKQFIEELPEFVEGRYYIVSAMVNQAAKREDFISPDTANAIRNDRGHIISVPGFVKYI